MPTWIDHDPDGFVYAAQTTEGPNVGGGGRPQVSHEDAVHAAESMIVRYVGGGFEVARDDRAVWRLLRARGLSGRELPAAIDRVREVRTRWTRDLAAEVLLPIPAPPAESVLPGLGDFAGVPGLRLRALTCMDLDRAAALAVETGIYPATCPDAAAPCCTPPEAHAWMSLAHRIDRADTWQTVLEFGDQPLQFELITRQDDQATFSLTMHLTRERPHWFWREAEAPVVTALGAQGVARLRSFTRSDRPDWIQALKDNYGAVEVAQRANTVHLEFSMNEMLQRIQGWPARRRVTTGTAGTLTLREGTAADLPALDAWIDRELASGRAAISKRVVREWYALDRAALLLVEDAGSLLAAQCLRARRGTTAGWSYLGNLARLGVQNAAVRDLVTAWSRLEGYTRLTTFVPQVLAEMAPIQAAIAAWGAGMVAVHTQFREPFVELEVLL